MPRLNIPPGSTVKNRPPSKGDFGRAFAVIALALSGCLTPSEFVPIRYYAIEAEIEVPEATPTAETIGVRPLEYAQYYKQRMVYRDDGFAVSYDNFHQWAELPRESVTRAIVDGLARSGRYADVGYAHDVMRPQYILSGQLRRFDAVRSEGPWRAVCEVRMELRNRAGDSVEWFDTVSADAPLETNDPTGFAAAMSDAVSKLVAEVVERMVTLDPDS